MKNHFPKKKRYEKHQEVFVLPNGNFYIVKWGPNTNPEILNLLRQVLTDCEAEYMGEL